MKRILTLVCTLAISGACSGPATQDVQAKSLTSSAAPAAKPVSPSGEAASPAAVSPALPPASENASPDAAAQSARSAKKTVDTRVASREVTLPAGTVLPVDLETPVGSDTSRLEQAVSGRLRRAIRVGGAEVLPAGTVVSGHVTAARRPGKVKGRGLIAMRFTRLDTPGAGATEIRTATISRLAPATKENDTLKVVGPAAAGAVIGRIAGGKSGAAKGAVVGGGAGAGYVLGTRGKDVRLGKGADLAVRLTAPVTFRVGPAR
jgi:hypothetical protein